MFVVDSMEEWGTGKTVLNTFSYTGPFSVAAAMGGAVKIVNIDAAKDVVKLKQLKNLK